MESVQFDIEIEWFQLQSQHEVGKCMVVMLGEPKIVFPLNKKYTHTHSKPNILPESQSLHDVLCEFKMVKAFVNSIDLLNGLPCVLPCNVTRSLLPNSMV